MWHPRSWSPLRWKPCVGRFAQRYPSTHVSPTRYYVRDGPAGPSKTESHTTSFNVGAWTDHTSKADLWCALQLTAEGGLMWLVVV